ncbi:hypothetical protein RKD29_000173 [Streptomyces tendae]|uniref:EF-hand domain-containing protein n=1 Tax=Streptomyces tendae TaxID=1932 RepID=UPI003839867C
MFDTDGNGFLEEGDFEALAARWSRLPRVAASPELSVRVRGVMTGWWQELSAAAAAAADPSRPGRGSMDELMTVIERLPAMAEAVPAPADTIFEAVDENGDGRISRDAHQRLVAPWHGRSMATDVFDRLGQDGDGYLGRAEFALLWTQFWISDDPTEHGNAMCGPVAPAA